MLQSGLKEITFGQAITDAIRQEMKRNGKIFMIGEDLGAGGSFGVSQGLVQEFGQQRILDAPISEAAIMGAALGAASTGMRPIAELMFVDFVGSCFDQICNQIAKLHYMSGGRIRVPLVVRTTWGAGLSAASQHSQALYPIFAHIPGLKCIVPSTPYDAKGLLVSALRQDDPVIFFENKVLYGSKGQVPEVDYTIPLGVADVKRKGKDLTIVAVGRLVHTCLEAAISLEKVGISAEVLDPRTISPLDEKAILDSLLTTHKLLVVDESYPRCGFAADVVSMVATKGMEYIDAPIKMLTPPHAPVPFSPALEREYLPTASAIISTAREICGN